MVHVLVVIRVSIITSVVHSVIQNISPYKT